MPPIRNITQVTLDNLHEVIPEYIHGNNIIIQNYDDMKEVYLGMLRDRYLFVFCLLYTSPSPRDRTRSRMPSSA